MPADLIRYQNGRTSLSDAVIASASYVLNPLGAAANIVATLSACAVEIGRFKSQAAELKVRHAVASDIIRARQIAIVGLFELSRCQSESLNVSLHDLRASFKLATVHGFNMALPASERESAQGLVTTLAKVVAQMHVDAGNHIVRLSDSLTLADTETAIRAWRALER